MAVEQKWNWTGITSSLKRICRRSGIVISHTFHVFLCQFSKNGKPASQEALVYFIIKTSETESVYKNRYAGLLLAIYKGV